MAKNNVTPLVLGILLIILPLTCVSTLNIVRPEIVEGYSLLFSQCLASYESLLIIVSLAAVINLIFGVLLAAAIRVSSKWRIVIESILDIIDSFPKLIFIIIITAVLYYYIHEYQETDISKYGIMITTGAVISISFISQTAKFVLELINQYVNKGFVLSLRTSGIPLFKIILRNILWNNCRKNLLMYTLILSRNVIIAEAGISFLFSLGFGGYGNFSYSSLGMMVALYRRNILFGIDITWGIVPLAILMLLLLGNQLNYLYLEENGINGNID